MKTTFKTFCIMLLLATCSLTACSTDDADSMSGDALWAIEGKHAVYDGEWTADKHVLDTARLEVNGVLKVRLPEMYLGVACFEREYFSSMTPASVRYSGHPVMLLFTAQGYTEQASFNLLSSYSKTYTDQKQHYNIASFVVIVNGVEQRVDVLTDEPGNAVYRNDTGLWTIGFTVTAFCVTNMLTGDIEMRIPHKPLELYYNATRRIR